MIIAANVRGVTYLFGQITTGFEFLSRLIFWFRPPGLIPPPFSKRCVETSCIEPETLIQSLSSF